MKGLSDLQIRLLEYLLRNPAVSDPKLIAKAIGHKSKESVLRELEELAKDGLISGAYEINPTGLIVLDYNHHFQFDMLLAGCTKQDYEQVFPQAHDIVSLAKSLFLALKKQEVEMKLVLKPPSVVLGNRADAQFAVLAKSDSADKDVIAFFRHILPTATVTARTLIPISI